MNFSSRDEATYRLIVEAIDASGEVEDARAEYDIDAIAYEVLDFDDAYDEDANVYRLNHQGWTLKERYTGDVGEMHFWDVVAENAL